MEPAKKATNRLKADVEGQPVPDRATVNLWPDTARRLGLGRAAIYQAYHRGDLPVPVLKIGKRLLVSRAALDRVLA